MHSCTQGVSLNVVAHQDDDILFMNPDISHDIQVNMCIVTIYMTAGDANQKKDYWQEREKGPMAAYAFMAKSENEWTKNIIHTPNHSLTQYYLTQKPTIQLIFLRLPDGRTDGSGYDTHAYESLRKLWNEDIKLLHPIDGSSPYTKANLISTIEYLIAITKPTTIRSLSAVEKSFLDDHMDHTISARIIQAANIHNARIVSYQGYAISTLPPNITKEDMDLKQQVFLKFAQHDARTCKDSDQCKTTRIYDWFSRQYVVR